MFIRKLVLSNLLARKSRAALTVAAVALSVSLVVAVTTGYASVLYAVHFYMDKYMGSVDAQVTRQNDPRGPFSESVLKVLRGDPQVRHADGRIEVSDPLIDKNGKGVDGRNVEVTGIARPEDPGVQTMTMEKGAFFNTSEGNVAVIDQALAERVGEGVGDELTLPRTDSEEKLKLKIVGIVHKPEVMAAAQQSMYVPLRTLQRFLGWDKPQDSDQGPVSAAAENAGQINRVTMEFNKDVDGHEFVKRMTPLLQKIDPNVKLRTTRDTRAELDKELSAVDLLSYLGGTVSMLAATFIVFSALSMGVTERQRTLAMLRAVGAFRGQIGALVIYEGMILALAGVVIGVPLGWIWVKVLSLIFHDVFSSGVVVSWGGVAFGAIGSALAALAASALPAWWATRVRPLEAMAPDAAPPSPRAPIWSAAIGLLLISIDPFLFFGPLEPLAKSLGASNPAQTAHWVQFFAHFGLGLPALMIGFFLLAPVLVLVAEAVIGPVVALAFRLNPRLVRQQLSTGLWRAAGTCAALMVGLAVLIVMEVQGNSALQGWKLPTHFPDIFVVSAIGIGDPFGRGSLSFDQIDALKTIPGVNASEVMPIAIASPVFGSGMFSFAYAAMNPEATMFFGIDPKLAFKMMELDFRQGNVIDAQRVLTAGKELSLADGTNLQGTVTDSGDSFIVTDVFGKSHTIAKSAVAQVPGGGFQRIALNDGTSLTGTLTPVRVKKIDYYDVEPLDNNSAVTRVKKSDVSATQPSGYAVAHGRFLLVTNEYRELKHLGVGDDFPLKNTSKQIVHYTICGVVWSPGIDVIVSLFDMGRQFDQRTAASVFGTVEDARRDFGTDRIYLFAANLKPGVEREDVMKQIKSKIRVEGLRAGDVRHIKDMILKGFYRLLHLASVVAYAAMAVASLGVTNTVMAGIRTRRWQFGVLRSIGVTRSQLLRLILSEATLLGIIACIMGAGAGAIMSKDAYQLSLNQTGYNPGITVPWPVVIIGVLIVMLISVAASLWPAILVSRTEPLQLLQAGRAAS
jgi:putative ABC transport system permease protein